MLDKHMNNEEKLEAIYQMTLENNEVLRSVRRQQYMSSFFSVIYWLVILGSIGSAYYFIKPFIPVISSNVGKFEETIGQFNQIRNQMTDPGLLQGMMKNVGTGTQPTE